jgi:phosphoribosylformylglycinamidine synthase subunit PurSL
LSEIHEIRVFPKDQSNDPRANSLRNQAAHLIGREITSSSMRVFLPEGITRAETERLASELLTDAVIETYELEPRNNWEDPAQLDVAYQPGAMNPEAASIMEGAKILGINLAAVDSSTEYKVDPKDTEDAKRLLVNETVQQIRTQKPETLVTKREPGPIETVQITGLALAELRELSKQRDLALDDAELITAQNYFKEIGREPRDGELAAIAGRWSEHCGHKTFNAKIFTPDGLEKDPFFRRIKDTAKQYFDKELVGAFDDNAGVLLFYEGMCICIKLETHNSPSAIEPYGGAATGVGGVERDIMGTGQGAKNILSIDIFCFAPPNIDASELPVNCLSPHYLQQRVIDGVRDYGNRMGIPTANGSVHYHPDFRGKPTVMVGALGIMPEKYARKGSPQQGDLVIAVGGRTGRDAVHGATFSSTDMTEETALLHGTKVQIGNAIEEKKMSDALLEARDADLIRAITDCGAAGFSSAIGEMGEDIGVQVDIGRAPLKYEGLAPWEIWMSESQERMVAAVDPDNWEQFLEICAKHGVEATNLGTFGTPEGEPKLQVSYGEKTVVDLDYAFLKHGLAQREYIADWQAPHIIEKAPDGFDLKDAIFKVMSHGNVCSKEQIVRQYDHEVQGTNALKPYGGVNKDAPNDAVVLTPILGEPYGLVVAHGLNPVLNNIDPYCGSTWAIAEAMANYTAVGGNPDNAFLVNNYVTATPDAHVMGALDKMVDAVCDSMHALRRPVISGKDSLSSRYKGKMPSGEDVVIDVPPVLNITVAGKIPNVEKTVTSDIKRTDSTLIMVGKPDYVSMGGSTFYDVADGQCPNVPDVDLLQLKDNLQAVHNAIAGTGSVLSCHDISEGGLIAAVSEMAFGGDCGVELNLHEEATNEQQLFNETAGCLILEVPDEQIAHGLFKDVPFRIIGKTKTEKTITANKANEEIVSIDADELKAAWKNTLEEVLA